MAKPRRTWVAFGSVGPGTGKSCWVVEYQRQPDEDEGIQTLFGPFADFNDAAKFGKEEFGMKGQKTNNWQCRHVWPVKKV